MTEYYCIACNQPVAESHVWDYAHGYDYETEVVCMDCYHRAQQGEVVPGVPALER